LSGQFAFQYDHQKFQTVKSNIRIYKPIQNFLIYLCLLLFNCFNDLIIILIKIFRYLSSNYFHQSSFLREIIIFTLISFIFASNICKHFHQRLFLGFLRITFPKIIAFNLGWWVLSKHQPIGKKWNNYLNNARLSHILHELLIDLRYKAILICVVTYDVI